MRRPLTGHQPRVTGHRTQAVDAWKRICVDAFRKSRPESFLGLRRFHTSTRRPAARKTETTALYRKGLSHAGKSTGRRFVRPLGFAEYESTQSWPYWGLPNSESTRQAAYPGSPREFDTSHHWSRESYHARQPGHTAKGHSPESPTPLT